MPAADYYRVLAEFWADGPDSETPPGHWFVLANKVSDDLGPSKTFAGEPVDELEWAVKTYLALGGAMHDAAIAAWGSKGYYDYIRPISVIRALGTKQRSDPGQPNYDPLGFELVPGRVEVITNASSAGGQRHEELADHVGKIAVRAWRGPTYISNPSNDVAGVGWILAEQWWPYQRPSFVTPPFAGYVSGHSTYSRAAAEVLTRVTGSPYFPGGLGEFEARRDQFSCSRTALQSVSCYSGRRTRTLRTNAASLASTAESTPRRDDIPGRLMGAEIGADAFDHAERYFEGRADEGGSPSECVADDETFCLGNGRFELRVTWEDKRGERGPGKVVPVVSDALACSGSSASPTGRCWSRC